MTTTPQQSVRAMVAPSMRAIGDICRLLGSEDWLRAQMAARERALADPSLGEDLFAEIDGILLYNGEFASGKRIQQRIDSGEIEAATITIIRKAA